MIDKTKSFSGFDGVTVIPEGVKRILPGSLTRLWQTDTLVLPSTLEYFTATAVTDLERDNRSIYDIEEIKIENNDHYTVVNGALYTKDLKTLVYVPSGMKLEELVIPEGVEEIGESACANISGGFMRSECKVVLPSTIRKISKNAFYNSDAKIDFVPKEVQLEEGCFYRCIWYKTLDLHNEIIPTNAFAHCQCENVRLYDTVKEIKRNSFSSSISKIYIPPQTVVDKEAIEPSTYSTYKLINEDEYEEEKKTSFGILEIGGELGSSAHRFALANDIGFEEVENTDEAIEAFFNKVRKPKAYDDNDESPF